MIEPYSMPILPESLQRRLTASFCGFFFVPGGQGTHSDVNGHYDDEPRLRQRNNRLDGNHIAQHDYNRAIGGLPSEYEGTNGTTLSSRPSNGILDHHSIHRRKQIRRQLKRKHQAKAPMVRWTKFMHSETKNNIVALFGEFIGTTMFLFFAFTNTKVANIKNASTTETTTVSATRFNASRLLYIALSFGFSLMVNAWVFFRISGGLFNPAVTLALTLLGALGSLRAVLLFIAQISGACFAAYLVKVMCPVPFSVQTTLGGGTSIAQGIWIEAICTAMLVFTIVMLAKEKHRATFIAPVGIGIALFIGELVAVYYTGGSLNPARSFGPAALAREFESNHWIYWVGPFIGTILAVLTYWLFKALEYEMANPGQDGDAENDPTQNPEHEIAHIVEERQAEVEEIKAIEDESGFAALNDVSATGSVLNAEGVIGMAVEGVRAGDEVHVQRTREVEGDLEANWPATQGVDAAQLEKKLTNPPKVARKTSWAETFSSRKSSSAQLAKKASNLGSSTS